MASAFQPRSQPSDPGPGFPPSSYRLGVALAVTLLAWGSAFAGIRAALIGYSPLHMAVFRYLVASLTLIVYSLAVKMPLPRLKDLPGLALLGLIAITFYHPALNYGETVVPAAAASFIVSSAPVWIALLGAAFLHERLRLIGWVGTIVSFMGVGVIAFGQTGPAQLFGGGLSWPWLLVLGCSIASAIMTLGQKRYLKRYTPLQIVSYIVWSGTFFLLPFGLGLPAEMARAPLGATGAVLYMGVVPGAIAYVTWAFVLSKMPASRAGSFLYIVPLVALLSAWAWIGEVPGPIALLGGILVLGGVVLVNSRGALARAETPPPQPRKEPG